MKKENKKSELEKELVYKPIYLPVRFFKKEAYIHIDDYKEAISKRENAVNGLEEENKKLKLENAKLKDRIITDENFEEKLDKENKKLKAELKKKEEDERYRHSRCMKAERQYEHSLGDDELIYEEGLYD